MWGSHPQILMPTGFLSDKMLQYDRASWCIEDTQGIRRFCVSANLKSHDQETGRGILECMRMDAWPEKTPKLGSYLPKDKNDGLGLEDIRDAFQYGMILLHPPRTAKMETMAA
jgi:hypothetical protein